MSSFFDPASEQAALERLARLTPDARAQFGKLDAHRMMCHLIDASRIALGEKKVKPGTGVLAIKPLRHALITWLPWPKGRVQTHPAFLETKPEQFEADRTRLRELLQRVAQRGREGGPFQPHPAFGDLSLAEWGTLVYRHVDHHLGQFGA